MKNLNINPFFLFLMSFVVLVISIYAQKTVKVNLINEENQFAQYKKMAINYIDLKESWSNTKVQKIIIDKLLINSKINTASVDLNNNIIKVKISNISTRDLNKFVNKLLNKKLNIKKFNLDKSSLEFAVGE